MQSIYIDAGDGYGPRLVGYEPEVCGWCGAEEPKNGDHCSPECEESYREMLEKVKGVA